MQNKGLIRTFAIIFGVICVYYLSFTWVNNTIEGDAELYGNGDAVKEQFYLDSIANLPIVNYGFTKYTYNEVQDKAINLGLDLKGGIDATLEISVADFLIGMSNNSTNPIFNKAIADATAEQKNSDRDYLELFFDAFDNASNGSVKLSDPSIFGNILFKDKNINFKSSNEEVQAKLREEVKSSISTTFEVLRSRIDRFGVTSPNISQIGESGRILIELPGAKDIERIKKLITQTAELQFWEVYDNTQTGTFFIQANTVLADLLKDDTATEITKEIDSASAKEEELNALLGEETDSIDTKAANPLFALMNPSIARTQQDRSSIVAYASVKDTATINGYLAMPEVRALLPQDMVYTKFLWDAQPIKETELINLYAIKSNREDVAPIQGDVIADASQVFDQLGANPEVSMTMNNRASKQWAKMTETNVGKFVAVVLDNSVYSAPNVNEPISGGRTSISGQFSIKEAQDLAVALKSGKLPAKARIIQSSVVGPSLGQEAIDSSTIAFLIALSLVLIWMLFYYGKAGIFADIALVVNILFIFGIFASAPSAFVLTLPGIAGIIITIGMSVDANVIIYERIKEALARGLVLKEAVKEGFSLKGALSAIIDANVTTFLTGAILFIFGSGPIKGFATTLMIGIATSLITAVFITRLLVDWYADRDRSMTFNTNITKGWFQNINVEFLKKRKIAYVISGAIVILGLGSIFTQGFNYGVDFTGGRTYTVRFDQSVSATEVAGSLKDVFGDAPEVKTYGTSNQLKITTKYKVDDSAIEVGNEIQNLLFNGLQTYLPDGTTIEDFKIGAEDTSDKIGIMRYFQVGPTIADDIKQAAVWAILGSLIVVFLYILFRFRKWQYSLGAVVAVFHDVLIVLAIFSLFWKVLPFDMEIGQSFIAALLTVVGYSLNDTVVIFDRIREFADKHPKWPFAQTVNSALSTTLGRTINTSLTTLIVLLAIFLFGGDSIKGFMFAMIIGVLVGTYSSLFIASPIMYDTTKVATKK